jgi:hypothetical protein
VIASKLPSWPPVDLKVPSSITSAENEFVRAERDFYRKTMEQSATADSYTEQLKDYRSSVMVWIVVLLDYASILLIPQGKSADTRRHGR